MYDADASSWDSVMSGHTLFWPLRLHEGCAGMGTASLGLKAMGVKRPGCVASELKAPAQEVLAEHLPYHDHVCRSMADHAAGCGHCLKHGQVCTVGGPPPEVSVFGPPCQPFSPHSA